MGTIVAAETILAIDLGKCKSVVCIYRAGDERRVRVEADAVARTIPNHILESDADGIAVFIEVG